MNKYISIDYGEKRTGIALSDDGGMIFPYKVVKSKDIIKEIQKILLNEKYDGIIVGNPMVGQRKRKTEELIKKLKEEFDIQVIEWDESCTTKRAVEYLKEIG